MVAISISTTFPEVQRQLDELHANITGPALVRAINRSIEPARPEMAREIAREFALSVGEVRDRLRIKRATFSRGKLAVEASLESLTRRGRSLNLINFIEKSVSFAAAKKRRAGGEGGTYQLGSRTVSKALELRFKIKRGGQYKVIRGAFIGNEGRTVFQREGNARLPIKALQTIDVPQMFNTRRINDKVVKSLRERFPRIVDHEVKYYTDRFNARRSS